MTRISIGHLVLLQAVLRSPFLIEADSNEALQYFFKGPSLEARSHGSLAGGRASCPTVLHAPRETRSTQRRLQQPFCWLLGSRLTLPKGKPQGQG